VARKFDGDDVPEFYGPAVGLSRDLTRLPQGRFHGEQLGESSVEVRPRRPVLHVTVHDSGAKSRDCVVTQQISPLLQKCSTIGCQQRLLELLSC
jgi:hypothetical protein